MSRCLNLSRLARPPVYSHVHFHRRRPGSLAEWVQSGEQPEFLDPSHPAMKMRQKQFPSTINPYFRLRAIPTALLMKSEMIVPLPRPQIDLWTERIARAAASRKEQPIEQTDKSSPSNVASRLLDFVAPPLLMSHPKGSIPMTIFFTTSKARTHKHCTKRRRLRTKIRGVINLIVTRGAAVRDAASDLKGIIFNDDEVRQRGDKWILPDWAYICYPEAKAYLTPYSELTQAMRESLQKIWDAGMHLEGLWAEAEMRTQKGLPPLPYPQEAQRRSKGVPYTPKRKKQKDNIDRKPKLHS
ncbi:hypothetical protein D9756_008691 [Leucocoprinus leucothites]|uniref:Uncharacterized protein n=1 Tax=Leucocoprinus leucothites TaxID=201217 RepID=A0A8H5CZ84_9AGAR|nr:hypothetical protein D9756_008691 [Leucoagaricus leucothites]